eukprot:719376_1
MDSKHYIWLLILVITRLCTSIESRYIIVMQTSIPPNTDYCQKTYGTTLATVRTEQDKEALWDAIVASGVGHWNLNVWIGLNDRANEGEYEWWDGTSCCNSGPGRIPAVTNKCIDYWYPNKPNVDTNT